MAKWLTIFIDTLQDFSDSNCCSDIEAQYFCWWPSRFVFLQSSMAILFHPRVDNWLKAPWSRWDCWRPSQLCWNKHNQELVSTLSQGHKERQPWMNSHSHTPTANLEITVCIVCIWAVRRSWITIRGQALHRTQPATVLLRANRLTSHWGEWETIIKCWDVLCKCSPFSEHFFLSTLNRRSRFWPVGSCNTS